MSEVYELNVPIYFNSHNKFIKDLIRENGVSTYIDEFPKSYISQCLSTFTDGYIILGDKSQIGRYSRAKKDLYSIKGFIIFVHDELFFQVQGRLICVDKSLKGQGIITILLDSVKSFAIKNRVTHWFFSSLSNEKLILSYERYGFNRGDQVFDRKGAFKAQQMFMRIDLIDPYDLDDYEYGKRIKYIEDENNIENN